jgi:hypothetical protein
MTDICNKVKMNADVDDLMMACETFKLVPWVKKVSRSPSTEAI